MSEGIWWIESLTSWHSEGLKLLLRSSLIGFWAGNERGWHIHWTCKDVPGREESPRERSRTKAVYSTMGKNIMIRRGMVMGLTWETSDEAVVRAERYAGAES